MTTGMGWMGAVVGGGAGDDDDDDYGGDNENCDDAADGLLAEVHVVFFNSTLRQSNKHVIHLVVFICGRTETKTEEQMNEKFIT